MCAAGVFGTFHAGHSLLKAAGCGGGGAGRCAGLRGQEWRASPPLPEMDLAAVSQDGRRDAFTASTPNKKFLNYWSLVLFYSILR